MSAMDPQKTAPFLLGEGAPCLILHGFTGSPWDMRPLGEALAGQGYRVRCDRLPGHGTTPEAMETVRAEDWHRTAEQGLSSFEGPERVFIVGFSMGALLAVNLAARFPERVRALALLAPAMDFVGPEMFLLRTLRMLPLLEKFHPTVWKDSTDIGNDGIRTQAPILAGYPAARIRDLFRVQDEARSVMRKVTAPTLVMAAKKDHVVSVRGARELARGMVRAQPLRFVVLRQGFHILARDDDAPLVFDEVASFFRAAGEREIR
jgi:carboxylesterase